MLRGRDCSYVTVHRNETYLYFNDLRADAERPGDVPVYQHSKRSKRLQPDAGARRARVASSFPWSKSPDRTALGLLVRLCAAEIQSRCATNGRQVPDRTASTSFRQRDGVSSSKLLRPAAAARATTRRRASLSYLSPRVSRFSPRAPHSTSE